MIQIEAGDIRSVSKAIQVLRLLGDAGELGVTELSTRLRVHKSTVSRLLATLERHGVVSRHPVTEKFGLGPALISLAGAALTRIDVRASSREHLERLAEQTGETVNLAILDGDQVVNIEKLPSAHYIRDIGWIGRRSPLHCTATGKALVAHLSVAELRRLLGARLKRFTPQTICAWPLLEEELAEVRRRGYAIGQEELEPGLVALAAPVYELGGRVEAAVSVSGPSFRVTASALSGYAKHVLAAAHAISRSLGYPAAQVKVG
ncbi:MAG TPA: IclR family transcriptional regulator [Gemmatimonadales bacterium]|nr:IclR family transcriptional regulator [Gemmatimonadales bacterium]